MRNDRLENRLLYKSIAMAVTIGIGALGLVNWFYFREALLSMMMVWGVNPYAWRAIDNASMVGLGMLWLTLVLISPYLMLRGKTVNGFWRNASILAGAQLLVLLLCLVVPSLFAAG